VPPDAIAPAIHGTRRRPAPEPVPGILGAAGAAADQRFDLGIRLAQPRRRAVRRVVQGAVKESGGGAGMDELDALGTTQPADGGGMANRRQGVVSLQIQMNKPVLESFHRCVWLMDDGRGIVPRRSMCQPRPPRYFRRVPQHGHAGQGRRDAD
jgi:hypothetical protein